MSIKGGVARHCDIRAKERYLYRFDRTHLSKLGNGIYLNNVQGALERFLGPDGPLVFPPL